MQKITPFLWFAGQAEAAVEFYLSVFKQAWRTATSHYGKDGPGTPGSVMTGGFERSLGDDEG